MKMLIQTIIITLCSYTLGNCCGGNEVSSIYNRGCISVKDCIERKLVIYDNTCIHQCPNVAPYMVAKTRMCFKDCPVDTVINGTDCLNSAHCTGENKVISNRTCMTSCLPDELFKKAAVCYTVCPTGTVANGTECIPLHECKHPFYVYNGTCTKECPVDFSYRMTCLISCPTFKGHQCATVPDECPECNECPLESDIGNNINMSHHTAHLNDLMIFETCIAACPVNRYLNGTRCEMQSKCIDSGMFILNSTCVHSCPLETVLSFQGKCISDCPKNTFVHELSCIHSYECEDMYKVIHNGSCIQSCPSSAPFIYGGTCLSECPLDMLIDITVCITKNRCRLWKHYYEYDGKCIQTCPNTTLYVHDRKCWNTCPPHTLRYIDTCITRYDCTSKHYYEFSGNCIQACPSSASLINDGTCVNKCPTNTLIDINSCVTSSTCKRKGYYRYKDKCVQSCPPDAPYALSLFYHSKCIERCYSYFNYYTRQCFGMCPGDLVAVDGECKVETSCTLKGNVVFNHTCLDKCPPNTFHLKSKCLIECPDLTVQDSNCLSAASCIADNRVIYNGSCVVTCPKEYKYNASGICSAQCPNGTYISNVQCYKDYECQEKGMVIFERKCIQKCPPTAQYQYKGYCVNECPQDSMKLGIFCKFPKEKCKFYLPLFDGNKCVSELSCQLENKYKYKGGCLAQCPDEYFSFENKCVHLPTMPLALIIICILVCLCLATVVLVLHNPRQTRIRRNPDIEKNTKEVYTNPCFDDAEMDVDCVPKENEGIDPYGLQLCDINTFTDEKTEDNLTIGTTANSSNDDKTDGASSSTA